jgi:Fic family protein
VLNRESVQSSLHQQFGLGGDQRKIPPVERGIAEMMVNLYETFAAPLTHETMFGWHKMLMSGERRIEVVGGYRTHADPMQVVSSSLHDPEGQFEAPPSSKMKAEMDAFITWFNETSPNGNRALPALRRAGIAHLYFVSIHPFEDGSGRIARALAEKSLEQNLGHPSLIALAYNTERAPEGLLQRPRTQQQRHRDCRLARLFRGYDQSGAGQHHQAGGFLYRKRPNFTSSCAAN